jgi:hypothetical protein
VGSAITATNPVPSERSLVLEAAVGVHRDPEVVNQHSIVPAVSYGVPSEASPPKPHQRTIENVMGPVERLKIATSLFDP